MAIATLTDTQGILALAAVALAAIALAASAALALGLRRMRRAQKVVLGEGERDVVGHAAGMQAAFEDLREYVGEVSEQLHARLGAVETGLQCAIAHCALVRYDAYNEFSGQQSVSLALLDNTGTGVVLTCIHHREQARVYLRRVHNGAGELELSPEETEAVTQALSPARADGDRDTAAGELGRPAGR